MATITDDILTHLSNNGRSTTGEMARELGYKTREIRSECKDLQSQGRINGEKSKTIPAYIIDDTYVVAPSRSDRLEVVKTYAPSSHSRAKNMSDKELKRFIRNQIADRMVGGTKIWEFWM